MDDHLAGTDAPVPGPFGISQHSDAGALTLLLQDEVTGLQVLRHERWCDVGPVPGTLTINIGDMLQVWSNDRYRAPLHRVRASGDRARFSAAYFLNPDYNTVVAPLATTVAAAAPARHPLSAATPPSAAVPPAPVPAPPAWAAPASPAEAAEAAAAQVPA